MSKKIARPIALISVVLMNFGLSLVCVAMAFADADFEELWFSSAQCDSTARLSVSVSCPESAVPREPIAFLVEISAVAPHQMTRISMQVVDEAYGLVHEAVLDTDLHRGRNQATFEWDASETPPGRYMVVASVDYADTFPVCRCMVPFSKVSALQWRKDLAASLERLTTLEEQLLHAPAEDNLSERVRLRLNIARDAARSAQTALQDKEWRVLDRRLAYLQQAINTLHAGLVFSGNAPEMFASCNMPSLENIQIRDGGFHASDRPVFLFGAILDKNMPVADQLKRLREYGLNFAAQEFSIGDNAADSVTLLEETVRCAKEMGIALAIQFNQEDVAGDVMDQWPELLDTGFVNMAHGGFAGLYAERLGSLAANLAGSPMIVCVSIARSPQFKFDGEPVRLQFIERIKERYPDRIDLNRLWRSHLSDYDEITIWGDPPPHSYHNRRAYQYEWQSFQRELISLFLAKVEQELSQIIPDIPLMLTLPDSAFLPGETRNGVNREGAASMMDINGCTAHAGAKAALYAMNYPEPHVYYTLMRSYTPNKPIVNLYGDIDMSEIAAQEQRGALVKSALWEAVMSGVNAFALPADSDVQKTPETLEAFTTAAQEINRLAPVVTAFQRAQPQIGILFSEASKILDDGVPHLESAQFAFEGASFAGYAIRFVTESQIEQGALNPIKVLILPETLAVSDATFERLSKYVEDGGMVARAGTPIPYNERGYSRGDVIRSTSNTVLVRGMNLPTEYLHAMDAAQESGVLPETARPINAFGYPLEGVRSRYVEYEGEGYLYIINLRKEPVNCYLTGVSDSGRDLILGRDVDFPRVLPPLEPMLVRMERKKIETARVNSPL
ncbi:MAG TPA: hypothetical protein ENN29_04895 [Candidatus Hydrogenedentes bacterium]|nr:hypothetical protein [Candidatus Hydrogenedentota bacterium]